jgi:ribosomal protein S27AE
VLELRSARRIPIAPQDRYVKTKNANCPRLNAGTVYVKHRKIAALVRKIALARTARYAKMASA